MATNKNPIFLNTLVSVNNEIDNAQGTTPDVVFTAGADGGAITNLIATSTDTVASIIVLSSDVGAQINVLGEVTVLPGAGTDGVTPSKNLLDSTAMPGILQNDGSMAVGANTSILAGAKAAVSAATVVSISSVGGLYSV